MKAFWCQKTIENNPEESYINKYQKHVACIYGYKLVCVDDKLIKPLKLYLGKDAVYSFINCMIEESKCGCKVMKKIISNKETIMTKTDNEDFKNFTKCWICDNTCVDGDVKVRDNFHIIEKYRGSAHRDCNINVKLNHTVPIVFNN